MQSRLCACLVCKEYSILKTFAGNQQKGPAQCAAVEIIRKISSEKINSWICNRIQRRNDLIQYMHIYEGTWAREHSPHCKLAVLLMQWQHFVPCTKQANRQRLTIWVQKLNQRRQDLLIRNQLQSDSICVRRRDHRIRSPAACTTVEIYCKDYLTLCALLCVEIMGSYQDVLQTWLHETALQMQERMLKVQSQTLGLSKLQTISQADRKLSMNHILHHSKWIQYRPRHSASRLSACRW